MSDLDGIWQATIDSPMGTRDAELQLESNGPAISGALTEAGSTVDIEGVLHGQDLEFVAALSGAAGPMILTFSGQLEGDTLEGDVEFGDQGVGTWTAERPD